MNKGKTRSSLFGIVAAYLLYIAYELYRDRQDANTTMTPAIRIAFIALFVVSAVGLFIYAFRIWKQSGKEDEEKRDRDDKDAMK